MQALDFAILFNSTVLVGWALVGVPRALEKNQIWFLGLSGVILIPFEVYLMWGLREYPFNILAGVFNFSLGLFGGYLMHHIIQWEKRRGKK